MKELLLVFSLPSPYFLIVLIYLFTHFTYLFRQTLCDALSGIQRWLKQGPCPKGGYYYTCACGTCTHTHTHTTTMQNRKSSFYTRDIDEILVGGRKC